MPQKPRRHTLKPVRGLTVLIGLFIVFLGSHSLLGNNSDETATPITQVDIPLTITQPGRYVVTEHLSMGRSNGRAAIWIEADDVHLDLNGFSLSGPLSSVDQCFTGDVGVGILVAGAVAVQITNGTVQGFREGIRLSSAKANRLRGLIVTATCFWGLRLSGTDHVVTRNRVSSNLGAGILLEAASTRLTRNIVNGNAAVEPESEDYEYAGIMLSAARGNVIAANDISGNGIDTGAHGVNLMGSHNNTIRGNRLHQNGGNGIHLETSSGNTIVANLVSSSGFYGIFLTQSSFYFIGQSIENLIQANLALGNRIGIAVDVDHYGNTFERNTALRNSITDVLDDGGSPSGVGCPNVWKKNTFVTEAGNFDCIQ